MAYDHTAIENKWQRFCKKNETFKANLNKDQKKYYALDMFPYHLARDFTLVTQKVIPRLM